MHATFISAILLTASAASLASSAQLADIDSSRRNESHFAVERDDNAAREIAEGKWGGSASCQIICENNVCRYIDCSVGFTYDGRTSAESALRAKLDARARAENGRISGSISFNIEMKFNQNQTAANDAGTADGCIGFDLAGFDLVIINSCAECRVVTYSWSGGSRQETARYTIQGNSQVTAKMPSWAGTGKFIGSSACKLAEAYNLPSDCPVAVIDAINACGPSHTAYCDDRENCHYGKSWSGPQRSTYSEAQQDANAHKQSCPGHNPFVL